MKAASKMARVTTFVIALIATMSVAFGQTRATLQKYNNANIFPNSQGLVTPSIVNNMNSQIINGVGVLGDMNPWGGLNLFSNANIAAQGYGNCVWDGALTHFVDICLQAAMTGAGNAGGGEVDFPAGTFYLTCAAAFVRPAHVALKGRGEGVTTFMCPPGATLPDADLFSSDGLDGADYEEFTFNLNNPTTPVHLHNIIAAYAKAGNADVYRVHHVQIINGTSPVFLVGGAVTNGNTLSNVEISDNDLELAVPAITQNQCIGLSTVNGLGLIPKPKIINNICKNSAIQFAGDHPTVALNNISGYEFGTGLFPEYNTFLAVTGATWSGGIATYTFSAQPALPYFVGENIRTGNFNGVLTNAVAASNGFSGTVSQSGVYKVNGGTCSILMTLNVSWDGSGNMTVNSINNPGLCTVFPPNSATITYVSGAATGWVGATVNLTAPIPAYGQDSCTVTAVTLTSVSCGVTNNPGTYVANPGNPPLVGPYPSTRDCEIIGNHMHDTPATFDVNNVPPGGLENDCYRANIVGNIAENLGGSGYFNYSDYATYTGNIARDTGKSGGAKVYLDQSGFTLSLNPALLGYNSKYAKYIGNRAYDDGPGTEIFGLAEGNGTFNPTLRGNDFNGINAGLSTTTTAITGASWSGPPDIATYTYATQLSLPFAGGQIVNISGVNPSGYNQQCLVLTATIAQMTCLLFNNPGSYVSGGQIAIVGQSMYFAAGDTPSIDANWYQSQLLSTATSAIQFTGLDTITYKNWFLECQNVIPSTDTGIGLQIGELANGIMTWEQAASYTDKQADLAGLANGASLTASNVVSQGMIRLGTQTYDDTGAYTPIIKVHIGDLNSNTTKKLVSVDTTYGASVSNPFGRSIGEGYWNGDTNPIAGLQIVAGITSGGAFVPGILSQGSCNLTGTR